MNYVLSICRTLLLRLLKFIVMITVCTHFVACVWYVLGCPAGTCQSKTWAEATFMGRFVSDADRYCVSLYWAVATMTTVGYGDFSATNVLVCMRKIFLYAAQCFNSIDNRLIAMIEGYFL